MAVERYRILEPHLIDSIPLAELARTGAISERTLQRWLRRYRDDGLAGLSHDIRSDRGRQHLPDHLAELTRKLASKRPRPPIAGHSPQGAGARCRRRVKATQLLFDRPPCQSYSRKPDRRRVRSGSLPRQSRTGAQTRGFDLQRDVAGRSYGTRRSRAGWRRESSSPLVDRYPRRP
ncbi:helix-turn-helix domain-containing protein [Mesorhizobium tianshanense]|uniref:helix-turn-helix domain-containing protein n=1 Tax=Mesorhizobium tianshanense TaxID=39844 RepID=UPI001F0B42EE|nr:helix-turn-helix domain-containing protein [Mesorhizobium tianshanense]